MVSQEQFLADLKELLSTNEDMSMDSDLLEIESWDSFSAVSFLAMIYEKYGVDVEPYTIAEAVFVEDLYNTVKDAGITSQTL